MAKTELIQEFVSAVESLVEEAETNYLFGEDEGEVEALEKVKDLIKKVKTRYNLWVF